MNLLKKVKILVGLLGANFVFVVFHLFFPDVLPWFRGGPVFLVPFVSLSLLGFLLVYLTRKLKKSAQNLGTESLEEKKRLIKNLNLVGYSAGLIFVSIVLHNLVSAFGVLLAGREFEEPVFFLLAVIILPVTFLVGVVRVFLFSLELKK
jgi:hypothetical protein